MTDAAMAKRLEGRTALVTGAASGNGRAIALRFAREGADVAIADVDAQGLEASARLLHESGRRVFAGHCDVSKTADIEGFFAAAAGELGPPWVVVANAGVVELDTDCLRLSEAQWDRTIDVNLKGVFFTLQAGARRMLERGRGGRLLAVASIMTEWGSAATPAYSASKGGVRQLVRSFALLCGRHGVTCNAIAPGFIRTAMTNVLEQNPLLHGFLLDRTPNGCIGEPEDVAAMAAFLAGDEARFVNGAFLLTDGGISAGLYSEAAARMAEAAAKA
jgi:glucose 1-dehydrogenase